MDVTMMFGRSGHSGDDNESRVVNPGPQLGTSFLLNHGDQVRRLCISPDSYHGGRPTLRATLHQVSSS
jgi:hypothetical protein